MRLIRTTRYSDGTIRVYRVPEGEALTMDREHGWHAVTWDAETASQADLDDAFKGACELAEERWQRAEKVAFVERLPSRKRGPVRLAPGSGVLSLLCWLPMSKQSQDRIFRPLVADLQHEYIEALAAGRTRRALALRVVYAFRLLLTFGAFCGSATLKRFIEIWKLV
jgi:hypothetical protein